MLTVLPASFKWEYYETSSMMLKTVETKVPYPEEGDHIIADAGYRDDVTRLFAQHI